MLKHLIDHILALLHGRNVKQHQLTSVVHSASYSNLNTLANNVSKKFRRGSGDGLRFILEFWRAHCGLLWIIEACLSGVFEYLEMMMVRAKDYLMKARLK